MKLSKVACGMMLTVLLYPMFSHAAEPKINAQTCYALRGATIPAAKIGLPVRDARVETANWNLGIIGAAYCELKGVINPVDPNAPVINFTADFPEIWNKKALFFGGAGMNGSVPATSGSFSNAALSAAPLQQGFVTFGSDSGHVAYTTDGSFALNEEALRNYAGDALKKTRDTIGQLIYVAYIAAPDRWYGIGGSNGGREVLALAQTWPDDWDGIVAWYPAPYIAHQFRSYINWSQALAKSGGYLGLGERQVLHDSVLAACDMLDGLKDGIVSNADACRKVFDPKSALQANGRPLRCASGLEDMLFHSCLSDAHINSMNVMTSPTKFAQASNRGDTDFPGIEWGADLGGATSSASLGSIPLAGLSVVIGLGAIPPSYPLVTNDVVRLTMPMATQFGDSYARYFVTRNSSANFLTFNTFDPAPFDQRLHAMEAMLNRDEPNLKPFFEKGGKAILVQGTADQLVPLESTRRYYNNVVKAVSMPTASNSIRYYEIPGMGHMTGVDFSGQWDGLSAVQQWVEKGTAPVNPIASDLLSFRTRPLCQYPTWPKYVGGDVNVASSFVCATN